MHRCVAGQSSRTRRAQRLGVGVSGLKHNWSTAELHDRDMGRTLAALALGVLVCVVCVLLWTVEIEKDSRLKCCLTLLSQWCELSSRGVSLVTYSTYTSLEQTRFVLEIPSGAFRKFLPAPRERGTERPPKNGFGVVVTAPKK